MTQTPTRPRDGFPDAWKPEQPGDALVGTIRAKRFIKTQYGERGVLEITETDTDRSWTLWVTTQSLRDAMNEIKPRVGDRLKIVFEGTGIADESGHEYQRWKVELLSKEPATQSDRPF